MNEIYALIGIITIVILAAKKAHQPRFQSTLNNGRAVTFPSVGFVTDAVRLTFGLGKTFRDAGFNVNEEWKKDSNVWVLVETSKGDPPLFTHNSLVREFMEIAKQYEKGGAIWEISNFHEELDSIGIDEAQTEWILNKYEGQFGSWHITQKIVSEK